MIINGRGACSSHIDFSFGLLLRATGLWGSVMYINILSSHYQLHTNSNNYPIVFLFLFFCAQLTKRVLCHLVGCVVHKHCCNIHLIVDCQINIRVDTYIHTVLLYLLIYAVFMWSFNCIPPVEFKVRFNNCNFLSFIVSQALIRHKNKHNKLFGKYLTISTK